MMHSRDLEEFDRLLRTDGAEAMRHIGRVAVRSSVVRVCEQEEGVHITLNHLGREGTSSRLEINPFVRIGDAGGNDKAAGMLLGLAGLHDEVRALNKRHERGLPLFDDTSSPAVLARLHRPQIFSVDVAVAAMQTPVAASAIERAVAAMHLLKTGATLQIESGRSWIKVLAEQALQRCLIENPALLHPRLLFQISGKDIKGRRMAPMLTQLMMHTTASLPSTAYGYSESQVKEFACHPAVLAAFTRAGGNITTFSSVAVGKTVWADVFAERHSLGRPAMELAILQIERLRKESKAPGGTILGAAKSTARDRIVNSLVSCIYQSVQKPGHLDAIYLEEIARSGVAPTSSLRTAVGSDLSMSIFSDSTSQSPVPEPVLQDRLERLLQVLKTTTITTSDRESAELLAGDIWSTVTGVATPAARLSVEGAIRCIDFMTRCGMPLEDCASRIRKSPTVQSSSAWLTALEMREKEASMTSVIDDVMSPRAASDATHNACAPARRRMAF